MIPVPLLLLWCLGVAPAAASAGGGWSGPCSSSCFRLPLMLLVPVGVAAPLPPAAPRLLRESTREMARSLLPAPGLDSPFLSALTSTSMSPPPLLSESALCLRRWRAAGGCAGVVAASAMDAAAASPAAAVLPATDAVAVAGCPSAGGETSAPSAAAAAAASASGARPVPAAQAGAAVAAAAAAAVATSTGGGAPAAACAAAAAAALSRSPPLPPAPPLPPLPTVDADSVLSCSALRDEPGGGSGKQRSHTRTGPT